MNYSEAAYFDGCHCQHIADYYEAMRIKKLAARDWLRYDSRSMHRRAMDDVAALRNDPVWIERVKEDWQANG